MFCIAAPIAPPSTQEQVTDKETGETKTVTKKGRIEKDDYIKECMTLLYNPQPPKKLKNKRKNDPSPKKTAKKKIHMLLKGADFNQITIKIICEQVYDSFPTYRDNLVSRKTTIKSIIKEYIASN